MTKHITIGVAALAFGVALASVPASAQTHYGKAERRRTGRRLQFERGAGKAAL